MALSWWSLIISSEYLRTYKSMFTYLKYEKLRKLVFCAPISLLQLFSSI